MSKNDASDADLKKVEKKDAEKKDFPVTEGQEDSSIQSNKNAVEETNAYPEMSEDDNQFNYQPEFAERDNIISKDSDKEAN